MTQVAAIATTIDEREDYFFGCGYDEYEERDRSRRENDAWIFRVEGDGEVRWSIKMAGRKPSMRSKGSDLCNGLHYNDADHSLAALIHTKSKQWRQGPKIDDFHDVMLVIITNQGDLRKALTLSTGYEMTGFAQNLVRVESMDEYFIAGTFKGFQT